MALLIGSNIYASRVQTTIPTPTSEENQVQVNWQLFKVSITQIHIIYILIIGWGRRWDTNFFINKKGQFASFYNLNFFSYINLLFLNVIPGKS